MGQHVTRHILCDISYSKDGTDLSFAPVDPDLCFVYREGMFDHVSEFELLN